MDRPSIPVLLLSLLWTFFSFSGLYKVSKSPYHSLQNVQCKSNNLPRPHALMASSLKELLMARETLIFILLHLGFLINVKKSYIEPTLKLEFLVVVVGSVEMTLSLPKEKVLKVQNQCKEILENQQVTVNAIHCNSNFSSIPPLSTSSTALSRRELILLEATDELLR